MGLGTRGGACSSGWRSPCALDVARDKRSRARHHLDRRRRSRAWRSSSRCRSSCIRSIDPQAIAVSARVVAAAGADGARPPLDSDQHRAARHARGRRHFRCPAILMFWTCRRVCEARRHRTHRARHRVHRPHRIGRRHRPARAENRSAVRRVAAARYRRAPVRPVRQSQSLGDVDHHGVPARFRLSAGARAAPSRRRIVSPSGS